MAASSQQAKVLRIGIIQDGKIVQERLIKSGDSVTVGESAKNTFVFPKTSLPRAEYPLFVYKADSYSLAFTEAMKGKVSSNGAVVALDKLRSDPQVPRQGSIWRLKLTEQDRGKISIDNVTILFQFVPPPPVQHVKPIQAMDFRPRLLESDDPIFLGFLAIFTALAAVLIIYVANTEPREINSLEEIPDRFTQLAMPPEDIEEDIEDIEDPEEDPDAMSAFKQSKKETEPDPSQGSQEGPKNKVEAAKAKEQLRSEVLQKSLLLKMITTRGEGVGTAENLWSDDDAGLADIDAALKSGVGGVAIESSSNQGLRQGSGTSTEDVDIGDLQGVGGGDVGGVGGAGDIQVTGSIDVGEGDMAEEIGDTQSVKKVVQSKSGQLKYCYEQQLKEDPSLAGRVEVEWNVTGGRVTAVSIFANTTGNQALAQCIVSKINRWRFPPEIEGEISWPFVFKPSS